MPLLFMRRVLTYTDSQKGRKSHWYRNYETEKIIIVQTRDSWMQNFEVRIWTIFFLEICLCRTICKLLLGVFEFHASTFFFKCVYTHCLFFICLSVKDKAFKNVRKIANKEVMLYSTVFFFFENDHLTLSGMHVN